MCERVNLFPISKALVLKNEIKERAGYLSKMMNWRA